MTTKFSYRTTKLPPTPKVCKSKEGEFRFEPPGPTTLTGWFNWSGTSDTGESFFISQQATLNIIGPNMRQAEFSGGNWSTIFKCFFLPPSQTYHFDWFVLVAPLGNAHATRAPSAPITWQPFKTGTVPLTIDVGSGIATASILGPNPFP